MDQLVFLALDQLGAIDIEFSLSGFPNLEPRVVYSEIFLIIEPSSSYRPVFPPWVFPGTICPEITMSLCQCAHVLILDLHW